MKVLVCGDRNWKNPEPIAHRLTQLLDETDEFITVIHGAARGADTLGGQIASSLGLKVVAVPAEWQRFGRSAGPIRNQAMLVMGPDLVLAFHENIEQSKGTRDMVTRARKAGIETEVIRG